jgi:NAD(P)-dependent dehydrogenase (short-subunit alcohol dehydrogenase family)
MPYNPSNLPSLKGAVFLVTGGNTGIGYHTAKHLALKGARVYIGSRSPKKGEDAVQKMKSEAAGVDINIHVLQMDHMDLSSVVRAADEFKSKETRLNGLVNNAGIMATAFQKSETDGFEAQWQTNYLAHWLLTWHLLDTLASTGISANPARVVNVTSNGHNFAPKGGIDFNDIDQTKGGIWSRYGMSKLGNILHAKKLNQLFGPDGSNKEKGGIWTAAVHPGAIDTELNTQADVPGVFQSMLRCFGVYKTPDQGSFTSLFAVAGPEFEQSDSGGYFVPVAERATASAYARNEKLSNELWDWTESEMRSRKLI